MPLSGILKPREDFTLSPKQGGRWEGFRNIGPEKRFGHLPPLEMLNLMPKSASGPPGLCDAVRMIPPSVLYFRIIHDTAGVERKPFCPTITLLTYNNTHVKIKTKNISSEVSIYYGGELSFFFNFRKSRIIRTLDWAVNST